MNTPPTLLQRIERFLADTGMKPSAFGRNVMRDPTFVYELRSGKRKCWPQTEERVLNWMLAYRAKPEAASS